VCVCVCVVVVVVVGGVPRSAAHSLLQCVRAYVHVSCVRGFSLPLLLLWIYRSLEELKDKTESLAFGDSHALVLTTRGAVYVPLPITLTRSQSLVLTVRGAVYVGTLFRSKPI
jgi:hypothetical protein